MPRMWGLPSGTGPHPRISLSRLRLDPRTRRYHQRRRAKACPNARSPMPTALLLSRELYQVLATLPASSSSWPTSRALPVVDPETPKARAAAVADALDGRGEYSGLVEGLRDLWVD